MPDKTYELCEHSHMHAIRCLTCGMVSVHPRDITERYCGHCHVFHDVLAEARRMHVAGASHECSEWRSVRGLCLICQRLIPVEQEQS
jgi:Fe2+ or Zn2+ uptake regulation protein